MRPMTTGAPGPSHLKPGDRTNWNLWALSQNGRGCPTLSQLHCGRVGKHEPKPTGLVSGHEFTRAASHRRSTEKRSTRRSRDETSTSASPCACAWGGKARTLTIYFRTPFSQTVNTPHRHKTLQPSENIRKIPQPNLADNFAVHAHNQLMSAHPDNSFSYCDYRAKNPRRLLVSAGPTPVGMGGMHTVWKKV
jgi:hypothetical protein